MELSNRISSQRSSTEGLLEEGMTMSHSTTNERHNIPQQQQQQEEEEQERPLLFDDTSETPSFKNLQKANNSTTTAGVVSRTGLAVLTLLAVQNCSKNLLLRYVMKDQPQFLTSAAVLGSECMKFTCSVGYILLVEKKSLGSIGYYLKEDARNTLLLAVPAAAYNFQMSMEYVALANLNAAMFSVLVQSKLVFTASFSALFLKTKLRYIQVISLVLLTAGCMLCNLSKQSSSSQSQADGSSTSSLFVDAKTVKGITATLCIAVSSGFASVYTEKVIKGQGAKRTVSEKEFGLAYTQVQLALMSILAIVLYALVADLQAIWDYGLFHNFTPAAALSVANSAVGGLIVAAVLKYADSLLKGYATAMSVVLTGVLSMILFGTELNAIYFMGIINVVTAVLLYNTTGQDMDQLVCS